MDELNKIIDKYTEGNYLFSKTAKEEMAKDIFALFSVSVSLFNEALRVMRDLAEHQNGAPGIRHEKEYNETMHEVWDFLEANETE